MRPSSSELKQIFAEFTRLILSYYGSLPFFRAYWSRPQTSLFMDFRPKSFLNYRRTAVVIKRPTRNTISKNQEFLYTTPPSSPRLTPRNGRSRPKTNEPNPNVTPQYSNSSPYVRPFPPCTEDHVTATPAHYDLILRKRTLRQLRAPRLQNNLKG